VIRRRRRPRFRHPAQIVVTGFATAIAIGTMLLVLPEGGASLLEAGFTATSAVCVAGLVVLTRRPTGRASARP
jgi:hypothetical protein